MIKPLANIINRIFSILSVIVLVLAMSAAFPAMAEEEKDTVPQSEKDFYASQSKTEIRQDVTKILDKSTSHAVDWGSIAEYENLIAKAIASKDFGFRNSAADIFKNLISAANGVNPNTWTKSAYHYYHGALGNLVDSRAEDDIEDLRTILNKDVEKGKITTEEAGILMQEAVRILNEGSQRAQQAALIDGKKKDFAQNIAYATIKAQSPENTSVGSECMTIEQLKAKYQSGCWSCLILNQLATAFLKTASTAYSLSQKAGLTLLGLGSILWILMWGLRNVSSLTQLEPGNILNELIKFTFKVALAYLFIVSGLKALRTYFITPIMGTGAVIAQQFWDEKYLKPYTEDYTWDDINEAEVAKEEKEARQQIENEPQKSESTSVSIEYTPEQQNLLNSAANAEKMAKEFDIPSFKIPGTNTGHLTSPAGCRIPPKVNCPAGKTPPCYGSTSHMGLDIGTSGVQGGVVFAMASGRLSYFGGAGSSAGYAASIETIDKNGNKWLHRYLHMMPKTHTVFKPQLNGQQVVQGQQIGWIGSTGSSSSAHLHIDIQFTGSWDGKSYNSAYVDPLRLQQGKFFVYDKGKCNGTYVDTFPQGYSHGTKVPEKCWMTPGAASIDLSSTYVSNDGFSSSGGTMDPSSLILNIDDVTYEGPTDIMDKSVMNSILGATLAITNTTAENMVLGNAISCYATLKNGGAWRLTVFATDFYPVNLVMWFEGILIWTTGFLLTMAVAYYLVDITYKMGFAVIAMPIVVGLWPFGMTKDKVMLCLSIMFKAAATFAFLAITTAYAMGLVDSVFDQDGSGGINALYEAMDKSFANSNLERDANTENIDFVASKLQLFSVSFLLLLFAFLYSYKLIQSTSKELVNKFFPDQMFGDQSPMHHWATATTKALKDMAMKPAGLARDIALHQAGVGAKNLIGGAVGKVRSAFRGGKGGGQGGNAATSGTKAAGAGMKAAGAGMQAAGKGIQGAGKGVQGAGKAISGVSQAANAVPVVGQAVAATGGAVGKGVEAAGKGVEAAGKGVEAAGKAVKQAGDTVQKTAQQAEKASGGTNKNEKQDESEKSEDSKSAENKNGGGNENLLG